MAENQRTYVTGADAKEIQKRLEKETSATFILSKEQLETDLRLTQILNNQEDNYVTGADAKEILKRSENQESDILRLPKSNQQTSLTLTEILNNQEDTDEVGYATILNLMTQEMDLIMTKTKKGWSFEKTVRLMDGLACGRLNKTYHCVFEENLSPFQKRRIYESLTKDTQMQGYYSLNPRNSSSTGSETAEYVNIANRQVCLIEYGQANLIISEYRFEIIGDAVCE